MKFNRLDSISEAILARAVDCRSAERRDGTLAWSNTVSNATEVRRLARRWARSLRDALETFMGPG